MLKTYRYFAFWIAGIKPILWVCLVILAFTGQAQAKSNSTRKHTPGKPDSAMANQPQPPNKPEDVSAGELQRMIAERDTVIGELRNRLDMLMKSDTVYSDYGPESGTTGGLRAINYALMSERAILLEPGESGFRFQLGYEHDELNSQSWWLGQFSGMVGLPENIQFEFSLPYWANGDGSQGTWGGVWMGLVKAFNLPDKRHSSSLNVSAGRTFPSSTGNGSVDAGVSFNRQKEPLMIFGGLTALWPLPLTISSYQAIIYIGAELALTPETALSASLDMGKLPPLVDEYSEQEQKRYFATMDFSVYKVLTPSTGLITGLNVKVLGDMPDLQVILALPMYF